MTRKEINEAKDEIDDNFAVTDHFFKRLSGRILLVIIVILLLCGTVGIAYEKHMTNSKREIFENSVTYVDGMISDLADYKYQFQKSDDVGKAAIADLVNSKFANFDESKIEDDSLRDFLKDCRNGNYTIESN